MKILIICNSSKAVYQFRYDLILNFLKKNYKVYILTENDGRIIELESIGCKLHLIKFYNSSYNPFNNIKLILNIYRYVLFNSFTHVITYGIKSNIYGGIVNQFKKINRINVITGINTEIYLSKNTFLKTILIFLYFLSNLKSSKIFLNNDDCKFFKKHIHKLYDNNHFIIQSEGIKISKFTNYKAKSKFNFDSKFTFLLACRLIKHKGVLEYINAAKKFKKINSKVRFVLCGGFYKARGTITKKIIDDYNRNGYIDYIGEISDIREIISQSHCVVLPSYREATGMILVEGALMGKPLIASDVAGCKEVVKDNCNGFLVKAQSVDDLFDKMMAMSNIDEKKYNSFSKFGIDFATKKFDVKNTIELFDKVI